ncbi:MAG: bifunctional diguanylate cyclase/phosphodiesterase [Lachnospiraceae bacterium]|nr:bifunctional diguanylate cyclase/phosphodiesterase [Lachnospiraceae bacterium]
MDDLRYQTDLLKAMNRKLELDVAMYRSIVESADNTSFFYYSTVAKQCRTFGMWEKMFPFKIQDIRELDRVTELLEDKYRERAMLVFYPERRNEKHDFMECKLKGKETWITVNSYASYDELGRPSEKILKISDITKTKKQNEQLEYLAYYDTLTGLLNRNYFVSSLADYIRKAEENHDIVSVMILNISNFKTINDGFGLVGGDELLQSVGLFLKDFSSENVIVSHFNADFFCIAIYAPMGIHTPECIFQAVTERIQEPFTISNGENIHIDMVTGVAEYPEATTNVLELINDAEIAMFQAKKTKSVSISYFNQEIMTSFLEKFELENKMKAAIFANKFELYYQPQFDVKSRKIRGLEALIRWEDEDGTMIPPTYFISIAESNGSIIPIGNWVLEESIRTYTEWQKKFDIQARLAVNISVMQYQKKNFVDNLLQIMKKYDMEPTNLELEITESVLIYDFDEMIEKMKLLKDFGIHLSLDDFGTGFSSLSYIRGLPVDTIKVDKCFVDDVVTDPSARAILEAVVHMVKELGFETIVEGVEDERQFTYLREIDCDNIQGFYLAEPMDFSSVEELLLEQTAN